MHHHPPPLHEIRHPRPVNLDPDLVLDARPAPQTRLQVLPQLRPLPRRDLFKPVEPQPRHEGVQLARPRGLEAQPEEDRLDAREAPAQVLGRGEGEAEDEVAVVVLLALLVAGVGGGGVRA